MRNRILSCLVGAGILAIAAAGPAQAQQPPAGKAAPAPRTSDGHPDLQGIWTNVTLTPMERLPEFKSLEISEAAAAAFEQKEKARTIDGDVNSTLLQQAGSAGTGAYNDLCLDRGNQYIRMNGKVRTSLIADPPDGRIPALSAQAGERQAALLRAGMGRFDSVKDRPTSERCLIGFGSTSGPPMLPVLYNNNYQIVQTADYVVILVEMVHDARIIRMNAEHLSSNVKQWLGDSVGRWEGDTLVVDTTNFSPMVRFRGASANLHVIERFRRTDAGMIVYSATIDDPSTFAKNWTVEYPFLATDGPVYEYACHEGNYDIPALMQGYDRSTSGWIRRALLKARFFVPGRGVNWKRIVTMAGLSGAGFILLYLARKKHIAQRAR